MCVYSLVHVQLSFDKLGAIRGGGYDQLGDSWEEFVVQGHHDPGSGEWAMQRRFLHVDSTVLYSGYADLYGAWGVYSSQRIADSAAAVFSSSSGQQPRQPRVFRLFKDEALVPQFPWHFPAVAAAEADNDGMASVDAEVTGEGGAAVGRSDEMGEEAELGRRMVAVAETTDGTAKAVGSVGSGGAASVELRLQQGGQDGWRSEPPADSMMTAAAASPTEGARPGEGSHQAGRSSPGDTGSFPCASRADGNGEARSALTLANLCRQPGQAGEGEAVAFDVAEVDVAAGEAEGSEVAGAALIPPAEVGEAEKAEEANAATVKLPCGWGRRTPRWWRFLPVAVTVAAAVAQLLVCALPKRQRS